MKWRTTTHNFTAIAGLTKGFDLNPGETSVKGYTVKRCIIGMTLRVPTGAMDLAWGTLVVPENLTDTLLPNPAMPEEAGWLCWDRIGMGSGGDQTTFHRVYDMASQRTFRSDEEKLKLIVNANAIIGYHFAVRTLFALP